jgi:hypothetical protein
VKKVIYVIIAVVALVAAIALFNVYKNNRTYTVGKNPKLSEIKRVYVMSSEYSSDYGYIYDLYSAGFRKGGYYVETDLFDTDRKEQVVTTVIITQEEYMDILSFIDGGKFAREDRPDFNKMDGYMDEVNQSADLLWDNMPDGPYELRLTNEAWRGFLNIVKAAVKSHSE